MAADFSFSGWPDEAAFIQCQTALHKDIDTSFPLLPHGDSTSFQFHGCPSAFPPLLKPVESVAEDGGGSASNSHSQAEKRRRARINAQLATLRKLIPKSDKMDKAALLGSVVEHVNDLKRKALEVSKGLTVPTDIDDVTIDCNFNQISSSTNAGSESNDNNIFIKASVCCEDRPELFSELNNALKNLCLRTVQADITCLGGRIKSILVLCTKEGKESVCINTLKKSLKVVLSRIAESSSPSNYRIKSRRQRFFLPTDHHSQ